MKPKKPRAKARRATAWFKRAPDGSLHYSIGASSSGICYPLLRSWRWVEFREVVPKKRKAKS